MYSHCLQGKIVPARGPHNFGWDPVFQPEGFKETYAEMSSDVKNTISHRYKALQAFRNHLVKTDEAENGEQPPDTKRAKQTTET